MEGEKKGKKKKKKIPRKLRESLQDYISKIKKPSSNLNPTSSSFSSSRTWILSGCKHPKTLSFAIDHKHHRRDQGARDDAANLNDIDRFLFENFRSLYLHDDEDSFHRSGDERRREGNDRSAASFNSSRFLTSEGSSSSLMEENRRSMTGSSNDEASRSASTETVTDSSKAQAQEEEDDDSDGEVGAGDMSLPRGCISVLKYSPNPQEDFRRSMEEMVEARLKNCGNVDWEFMEELLFCYVNLNEKKSHKYILSAFVDVIVVLRQSPNVETRTRYAQVCGVPRESRRKVRSLF